MEWGLLGNAGVCVCVCEPAQGGVERLGVLTVGRQMGQRLMQRRESKMKKGSKDWKTGRERRDGENVRINIDGTGLFSQVSAGDDGRC